MISGLRPAFEIYRRFAESEDSPRNMVGCYKFVIDPRDDLAHIFYMDCVVLWDYHAREIVWTDSVHCYATEVPYFLNEQEWNNHVGRCLQGILVACGDHWSVFCDILGCGRIKVSNMLNGKTELSTNDAVLIMQHYGLTMEQLLGR